MPYLRQMLLAAAAIAVSTAATAQTTAEEPKRVAWTFDGPFGSYDRGALQRGFQVYKEVCSGCHSLSRVAIRTLGDEGGPGFDATAIRALAATYKVPAGPNDKGKTTDDMGQPLMREATPADFFPPPFPNVQAARAANNGAAPPDLSLLVKAREGHQDYIYSILTGFGEKPPAGVTVPRGMQYNPYFPGRAIGMPPPLAEGSVTYSDGTKATIDQEAKDVVTFLSWAAEPKMEERKRTGAGVFVFLAVFGSLLFLSYRRIWRDAH